MRHRRYRLVGVYHHLARLLNLFFSRAARAAVQDEPVRRRQFLDQGLDDAKPMPLLAPVMRIVRGGGVSWDIVGWLVFFLFTWWLEMYISM